MKQGKIWGSVERIESDGVTRSIDILKIKAGGHSSEHWHEYKSNLFFVVSGRLEIWQWLAKPENESGEIIDVTAIGAGESTMVPCGVWHQFRAIEDSVVIETAKDDSSKPTSRGGPRAVSEILTTSSPRVNEILRHAQSARTAAEQTQVWLELKKQGVGRAPCEMPDRTEADKRPVWEKFPDGCWRGHRCFIIGGGPSLTGFDFNRLRGELVIGLNLSYERFDSQILFSMDSRFYEWIMTKQLGVESRYKFENFQGTKIWLDTYGYISKFGGIQIIPSAGRYGLSRSVKDGLCHGNNTGYAALNLAICLGASPIYLLGYDMTNSQGRTQWHDRYPQVQTDEVVRSYADEFNANAQLIASTGCQVMNLNPESKLKCFPFANFEDLPKIDRPIIISYYTRQTIYEEEMRSLLNSCRRWNLEYDIVPIDDRGGWQENTRYKARFIKQALHHHPGRGVVFVDADGVVQQYPFAFENIAEDVGFCWRDYEIFPCHSRKTGKELLSGTIYFSQSAASKELLDLWIAENERRPDEWEQRNLERVLVSGEWLGRIREFPSTYCQVFDLMKGEESAVIEHFQASRRSK